MKTRDEWGQLTELVDAMVRVLAQTGPLPSREIDKAIRLLNRLSGRMGDAGMPPEARRAFHSLGFLAFDERLKRAKMERALRRQGRAILSPSGMFVAWRRSDQPSVPGWWS